MKFLIEIEGRARAVEFRLEGGLGQFILEGRPVESEAAEIEHGVFSIVSAGRSFIVRIVPEGESYLVEVDGRHYRAAVRDSRRRRRPAAEFAGEGRHEIASPMPGKVVRVMVEERQGVEAGQGLLVVEAMKMQNEIKSPKAGVVARLLVQSGQAINAGQPLVVVE